MDMECQSYVHNCFLFHTKIHHRHGKTSFILLLSSEFNLERWKENYYLKSLWLLKNWVPNLETKGCLQNLQSRKQIYWWNNKFKSAFTDTP